MSCIKIPKCSFMSSSFMFASVCLAVVAATNPSCGDGKLNPIVKKDGGLNTDTGDDIDTGSDTDTGIDTDTDTVTDTETGRNRDAGCPFNSGYPCACDGSESKCEDQSDCVIFGGWSIGVCLLRCDPDADASVCADNKDFGIFYYCDNDFGGFGYPYPLCLTICDRQKKPNKRCPPHLVCVRPNPKHDNLSVCLPPLR